MLLPCAGIGHISRRVRIRHFLRHIHCSLRSQRAVDVTGQAVGEHDQGEGIVPKYRLALLLFAATTDVLEGHFPKNYLRCS